MPQQQQRILQLRIKNFLARRKLDLVLGRKARLQKRLLSKKSLKCQMTSQVQLMKMIDREYSSIWKLTKMITSIKRSTKMLKALLKTHIRFLKMRDFSQIIWLKKILMKLQFSESGKTVANSIKRKSLYFQEGKCLNQILMQLTDMKTPLLRKKNKNQALRNLMRKMMKFKIKLTIKSFFRFHKK